MIFLQLFHELADRTVHELDLAQHAGRRGTSRIRVASLDAVHDQFLPNTHGLKVHAVYLWDHCAGGAKMGLAVDPVEYGIDLELVVALDVVEGPGPIAAIVVRHRSAIEAGRGLDARQRSQA